MGSPFLMRFSREILGRLHERERLVLTNGAELDSVVEFVADFLGKRSASAHSLISSLVAALLACESVEELYADDEELEAVIAELPASRV